MVLSHKLFFIDPLDPVLSISSNSEFSQNSENFLVILNVYFPLQTIIMDDLDIPCYLISRVSGVFPGEIIPRKNTNICVWREVIVDTIFLFCPLVMG